MSETPFSSQNRNLHYHRDWRSRMSPLKRNLLTVTSWCHQPNMTGHSGPRYHRSTSSTVPTIQTMAAPQPATTSIAIPVGPSDSDHEPGSYVVTLTPKTQGMGKGCPSLQNLNAPRMKVGGAQMLQPQPRAPVGSFP